jgi:hypothetical protein
MECVRQKIAFFVQREAAKNGVRARIDSSALLSAQLFAKMKTRKNSGSSGPKILSL